MKDTRLEFSQLIATLLNLDISFSSKVEELASKLSETLIHIRTEEQMKRQDLTRGKKPNLLTRVKQFFVFEFRPEEDQHDETLTDYLEKSCNQLAFIFMVRLSLISSLCQM